METENQWCSAEVGQKNCACSDQGQVLNNLWVYTAIESSLKIYSSDYKNFKKEEPSLEFLQINVLFI